MVKFKVRRHRMVFGGLCITVGAIVMLCFIPFWIWMLLLGLALALLGVLCIVC